MQARDAGGVGCGWHATVSVEQSEDAGPGRACSATAPEAREDCVRVVSPVRGRVRRACLVVPVQLTIRCGRIHYNDAAARGKRRSPYGARSV